MGSCRREGTGRVGSPRKIGTYFQGIERWALALEDCGMSDFRVDLRSGAQE